MPQQDDDMSADQFGHAPAPREATPDRPRGSLPYQLVFCSGAIAGRKVALREKDALIGRSSSCDIKLPSKYGTVSGRHAILGRKDGSWMLRDADSQTGTFLNGQKLAPGESKQVHSGDWILFGISGAVAMLLGPRDDMPSAWIVLEPESKPGSFLTAVDQDDVRVAQDADGGLMCPPPKRSPAGYRFRLDREPPTVQRVAANGKESTRRPVEAGALLRPGEGRLGLRVLGLGTRAHPHGQPAIGETTLFRAVRTVARKKYALPVASIAVVLVAAIVLAVLKFDSTDDRQLALEKDLGALQARMEREFIEQQAMFRSSIDDLDSDIRERIEQQRRVLQAQIDEHREETEKRLAKLGRSERERFAAVLEKYNRSVFLILVENTFPTLKTRDGKTLRQAGWGTGWIARKDGLLITNKHVVQGWKFDAELMAHLGTRGAAAVKTRIWAWPNGSDYASGAHPNQRSGYNNTALGNLRFVSAAPDRWNPRTVEISGSSMTSRSHRLDANDMAALQLSGSGFVPLPLMRDPELAKPLTAVMVLGFPLGATHLQQGIADLSASIGTIRWIRDTVSHTASTFPGNSGGPILTLDGEVVGLLNAGATPGGHHSETFGFGLRSDLVRTFVESVP